MDTLGVGGLAVGGLGHMNEDDKTLQSNEKTMGMSIR